PPCARDALISSSMCRSAQSVVGFVKAPTDRCGGGVGSAVGSGVGSGMASGSGSPVASAEGPPEATTAAVSAGAGDGGGSGSSKSRSPRITPRDKGLIRASVAPSSVGVTLCGRSEERRVGKECGLEWAADHGREKWYREQR